MRNLKVSGRKVENKSFQPLYSQTTSLTTESKGNTQLHSAQTAKLKHYPLNKWSTEVLSRYFVEWFIIHHCHEIQTLRWKESTDLKSYRDSHRSLVAQISTRNWRPEGSDWPCATMNPAGSVSPVPLPCVSFPLSSPSICSAVCWEPFPRLLHGHQKTRGPVSDSQVLPPAGRRNPSHLWFGPGLKWQCGQSDG